MHFDTIMTVAAPYLCCSIVVLLMIDASNSVVFSAVLDYLHGPELITPLPHLLDHGSVTP